MGAPILTAAQMRWCDRQMAQRGLADGLALMQRAGESLAAAAERLAPASCCFVVLAGPGNNGGDAFVAARLLHEAGRRVRLLNLTPIESMRGEALQHAELALAAGVPAFTTSDLSDDSLLELFGRCGLLVDGLFGTGLSRPLSGEAARLISLFNRSDTPVLSVDLPSGLDADSGRVLGTAVRADWTLPIAADKWGQWLGEGHDHVGELLQPADIGMEPGLLRESFATVPAAHHCSGMRLGSENIAAAFSDRSPAAHKNRFGHLRIYGGSKGYSGAPILAARGAFAAGCGLVSVTVPGDVWPVAAASMPEAMVHAEGEVDLAGIDALAIGPGWSTRSLPFMQKLIASDLPLLLDATALMLLADRHDLGELVAQRDAAVVLTPHPGEAARLLGISNRAVQADRIAAVVELARRFNAIVLLKGAGTLIANPAGEVALCPFGNNRLAVAGSGDVLAGMVGALLARGVDPLPAAQAAVALHALAGEGEWFMASGLAEAVHRLRLREGWR